MISRPDSDALRASWHQAKSRVDRALTSAGDWLDGLSRPQFLLAATGAALGLSLLFFAPRLCILVKPMAGTYEWDRATTFLSQCAHPFAAAGEPAMRWRLLPALVAGGLCLRGYWPLVIPWIGLIGLLAYVSRAAERLFEDRLAATLLACLLATSGAVLTITTWNGINDAWFILGLLMVALSPRPWVAMAACLWAPWVDERFVLGLPLALFCRIIIGSAADSHRVRNTVAIAAAGCIYPLVRLVLSVLMSDRVSAGFVSSAVGATPVYLPFAHFGWWNGFRAGWLLILLFFWYVAMIHGRRMAVWGALALGFGWGSVTLLAADLTRSTNLLMPLLFAGAWVAARAACTQAASRLLLVLVAINLAIPYEMATYNKSLLMHSLPFELVRLVKDWR